MTRPQALEHAHDTAESTPATLAGWLASRDFGLTLSSGFFGFFAHAGLIAALESRGLRPAFVTGASAGALAGGFYAAGLDASTLENRLMGLEKADFWDPWPGLGLLRGKKFDRLLRQWLPVQRFEDCAIPLAVSAFDVVGRKTRVLRSGDLASGIRASCSVPLMFQPVWLHGRPHLDGGARDWAGIAGMPDGLPVLYHHLPLRLPWLSLPGTVTGLPTRDAMRTIRIHGLPAPRPDDLGPAPAAFEHARVATLALLDGPCEADVLEYQP